MAPPRAQLRVQDCADRAHVTTDDVDKLTPITHQVVVAYAVGWMVGAVWPATPGAAPLGVTIAGLGTALLAVEVLRICSRGAPNARAAARPAWSQPANPQRGRVDRSRPSC